MVTVTISALIVVSALAATPANAATGKDPGRIAVPASTPKWLAHAKATGHASKAAPVSARVYLAPNGGLDALKAAAIAASTPGSTTYRKFLTPEQFNASYAPTKQTVATVGNWLERAGLTLRGVGENNSYLEVSGTVAAAQSAFAVKIGTFQHDGQSVQAPESTVTVPSSVASAVLTVDGLDTSTLRMTHSQTLPPPPASFVNGRPCSIYYGQLAAKYQADYQTPLPKFDGTTLPYAVCGYTGPQLRAAYEGSAALSGTGITVAVVDAYAAPTIAADANQYAEAHGDGSYVPGQFTQALPKANSYRHVNECDAAGWYGEESLDVEAVHAMAPSSKIRYYAGRSCYDDDLLATLASVVSENKAQLVTNSWGAPDASESSDLIPAYEKVFLQGALQGISFMFSSGDNGDELANTGLKQTDYPASDPYVTAVGGTSTAIDANGTLAWQAGWGTQKYSLATTGTSWSPLGFLYGAGGGYSSLFNRPAYQNGVVNSTIPGRAVPDVAMDADPTTGMLVGQTQTFPDGSVRYGEYRIGGTSLASPLFAGMTALALQHGGGVGLGLLNPTIYGQAKAGTFSDVQGTPKNAGNVRVDYANLNDPSGGLLYSVRTFGQDSSLPVSTGWDAVTGIGSPNTGWLTSLPSPL